ncbi:hypothetical protein IG631_13870 [Alternaria alternata]|nr:hypothetical protein IG631_13870 [Alternaria alternata]
MAYRHTAPMLWRLPRCARSEGLTQVRYLSMRLRSILMKISGVIVENLEPPCGTTSIAE